MIAITPLNGHKRLSSRKVVITAPSNLPNKFQTGPSSPGLGTGPGTVFEFIEAVPERIFSPAFFYLLRPIQAR